MSYAPDKSEIADLKSVMSSPGYAVLDKMLDAMIEIYRNGCETAPDDFRYLQGKLRGIRELRMWIDQLTREVPAVMESRAYEKFSQQSY